MRPMGLEPYEIEIHKAAGTLPALLELNDLKREAQKKACAECLSGTHPDGAGKLFCKFDPIDFWGGKEPCEPRRKRWEFA